MYKNAQDATHDTQSCSQASELIPRHFLEKSNWVFFFLSSRRRHTRSKRDWRSDVCSSDLVADQYLRNIDGFLSRFDPVRRRQDQRVDVHTERLGPVRIEAALSVDEGGNFPALLRLRNRSEERRVGKGWWWRWVRVGVARCV